MLSLCSLLSVVNDKLYASSQLYSLYVQYMYSVVLHHFLPIQLIELNCLGLYLNTSGVSSYASPDMTTKQMMVSQQSHMHWLDDVNTYNYDLSFNNYDNNCTVIFISVLLCLIKSYCSAVDSAMI